MCRLSAALLALAPYVLGTPFSLTERDYSNSTCTNDSTHNFQWLVEGFDFHASYIFSTPAHQNSWGYVNFNLSNPAVPDLLLSCSAQSDQLQDFFYGTQWYKCTTNGTSYGPAPASFAFNRPTGELDINQTWTCRDRDPKWPTTFHGSGKANLSLGCVTTNYQNPNWTIGEIYSDEEIKCSPETLTVKPYLMTAVA
ncbi:hypothetical protein N0V82_003306 [Gnomoniopsis sp. IMI 355080]|nr:hypothetical protein N0V82_003306 [Gnomoniopsis sp. IMI 355080]